MWCYWYESTEKVEQMEELLITGWLIRNSSVHHFKTNQAVCTRYKPPKTRNMLISLLFSKFSSLKHKHKTFKHKNRDCQRALLDWKTFSPGFNSPIQSIFIWLLWNWWHFCRWEVAIQCTEHVWQRLWKCYDGCQRDTAYLWTSCWKYIINF